VHSDIPGNWFWSLNVDTIFSEEGWKLSSVKAVCLLFFIS